MVAKNKRVYRSNTKRWKTFKARDMRNNPTPSEKELWKFIRKKQLGVKFRRQHIILGYIADFYCPSKRIVIEIDGGSHINKSDYDSLRDFNFYKIGIKTIRIPANLVMTNIIKVLSIIKEAIEVEKCYGTYTS